MRFTSQIRLAGRTCVAAAASALAVASFFLCLASGLEASFFQEKTLRHDVNVNFKLIQVYVTTRGGQPVSDLTASDFQITDNGRAQAVAHFEKHFLETEQDAETSTLTLPTNRKFFLLFDFAFMDARGIVKAKDAALKFLGTEMLPTDEIGLISYSASRGLVIHEYLTVDHERIRRIVEGFGLQHHAGRAENLTDFIFVSDLEDPETLRGEQQVDTGIDFAFYENQARLQTGQRLDDGRQQNYSDQARLFLGSLRQLARVFRLIPGFKNVILFSGGIAGQLIFGKRGGATVSQWSTPEELAQQLRDYDAAQADSGLRSDFSEMLKDFKASNSPVYAVDVSRTMKESDVTAREGFDPTVRELDGADSLKQFASGTGGRFYANTVDNQKIASDLQTVTGAYYVLGFYVDEKWDGKYHKIKVRVKRKGLNVVAQGGYFGARPFKTYTAFEKLLHVVDLALSDTPQVQMPYELPVGGMSVMVKGWPQLLVFGRASLRVHREVLGKRTEAYLLLFDEKGDCAFIKRFRLAVPETGKETLIPSFLLAVKPGNYSCRLVIRNMETGRGARGMVPLSIPSGLSSGLALDPPLLLAAAPDSLEVAASPEGSLSSLYGYDPDVFVPLLGEIPRETPSLQAALRLMGLPTEADVDIAVSRGDPSSSVRTDLPASILKQDRDKFGISLLVEFSLEGMDPGPHVLEFKARVKETGAEVSASVDIVKK